jgi:hypothetical protein
MSTKEGLKSIVMERLREAASSIFIGRALAVLDESADTKESLLCAADSISKRIALFIDTVLAKEIFDILTIEIENRIQTPGTRRKHERVNFCTKVRVTHNGATSELIAANLSLGGIYLRTPEPFGVGSKMELSVLVEGGSPLLLKGTVMHAKIGIAKEHPGMGIEFNGVGVHELKILTNLIKKASA